MCVRLVAGFIMCVSALANVHAQDAGGRSEEKDRAELAKAIVDGKIPLTTIPKLNNESETRIFAALEKNCTLSFKATPLIKVLESISEQHNIPIWLNTGELDLIGVDHQANVSLAVENTKLRSALALMLDPRELTYIVRHDVLEITSRDSADSDPINRVYRLPDGLARNMDSLMNAIQQTVDPDSWLASGGTSVVVPVGQLLIVSAPQSTHLKIQDLLSKIIDKLDEGAK